MAIRLRSVGGIRVALCAAETDEAPGDVYLHDGEHYALAAKFSRDWAGQTAGWPYPEEWAAMDTQKRRDAEEELMKWIEATNAKTDAEKERAMSLTIRQLISSLEELAKDGNDDMEVVVQASPNEQNDTPTLAIISGDDGIRRLVIA